MNDLTAPQTGKPLSLRRNLVLASWAIILVGMFGATVVAIQFVYRAEQAVWDSRLTDMAQGASRSVSNHLTNIQGYAQVVALLEAEILEDEPQVIENLLEQNPTVLEMIRLDEDGKVIAAADGDNGPVLQAGISDPQQVWLQQAAAGFPFIGDPQIFGEGAAFLIIAVPAPDGGLVALRWRLDVLQETVSEIRFGESGQIFVVDPSGKIVGHPNPELLGQTNISDYPEIAAIVENSKHPWQGNYTNFSSRTVLGTTMPIADTQWLVFAEIDQSEVLATSHNTLLLLGGGVLMAGALVALSMFILIYIQVIKPVRELRDGAIRFGEGDLDYRILEQAQNEIGVVAEAFNEMAARLQEREIAFSQARDEAVAASRFKSSLLANISHDLMTPLNIVLGYADMLQEGVHGPLNERQQGIVERIFANAQRLINLIRSLLDQAQIEAGRIRFTYLPFSPEDLLQSVVSVMGVLAQRKKLGLSTEIDPALPKPITGDFQRLQQILMNLTGNAIKFTDQGSVLIRFHPHEELESWCILVSDTGRGIPAEALEIIFDPFQRVDGSTTRTTEGIGLGLSIVNQLTNLMGGEVQVTSEINKGSQFHIVLPLNPPGDEDEPPSSPNR
jgi:signal transduction histidine kinase